MSNTLYQKSLVSIDDISEGEVNLLYQKADEAKKVVAKQGADDRLNGKIMAALFFEPSSRTFSSFITAMQRLGGGIIPLNGMQNTSVAKGESLEDSAKVFSSYADIIVTRFSEKGSTEKLAKSATVPVINAGDGIGEHPTQALLDCYTIEKHFESFGNLRVGMIGDLLNGRTVHSLTKLLLKLGTKKFIWVSPKSLKMPEYIKREVKKNKADFVEAEKLEPTIGDLDVIYDTRVQKERFSNLKEYDRLKLAYIITPTLMKKAKKTAVLMHPLPRVGEIAIEVDRDPRALYLREQMRNGMYVRMALLDLILRK
ncbi:aspartate carbamoyltransferase [Candidatus Gottesmanbacteria bacterium]|nr:aspartate carbamoyltransferase [Candidatus Gottesmanbacteria bacterium]